MAAASVVMTSRQGVRGPAHAKALQRASGDAEDLWIDQDMGHGEPG